MKKTILIFAIVIVMIGCISCDRQKETNKSDRFPGFAQLGSTGEWSKLYIDLNSAKKDGFIVTFKFIRVVEGGYVIQDCITDCRNTFQSLDGVQYKDDGTSDRKYPGDAAPIPYQNQPGIAELVNAACNKTGMPAVPAPEVAPEPVSPEPLPSAPTLDTTKEQSSSNIAGIEGQWVTIQINNGYEMKVKISSSYTDTADERFIKVTYTLYNTYTRKLDVGWRNKALEDSSDNRWFAIKGDSGWINAEEKKNFYTEFSVPLSLDPNSLSWGLAKTDGNGVVDKENPLLFSIRLSPGS